MQETSLRLFQGGLGNLRSIVGFCQRADLVGGAVNFLAECHLAALQDRREPMGQRFDLCFKPGPAQLPKQSLEVLADDAVGQDVILRDWQLRVLLGQPEKLDGLVGAREAGKPGCRAQRRGEAAWPNARRTEGPFSPVTREAEQERLECGGSGQWRSAHAIVAWPFVEGCNRTCNPTQDRRRADVRDGCDMCDAF